MKNLKILGNTKIIAMQQIKENIIPLLICIISILTLAIVAYPFLTAQFTIINESIAIPDFALDGSKIINDKNISQNIVIQLLGGYKILEGFFFHHHMTILLPVYYLDMGIDRNINQYGVLTSYYIFFISKFLFREVSLNSYMSIIHSFLIIFPICLSFIGYKVYNNKYLVSLLILVFTLTYILLDFVNFYLTPTISPMRQIFIPFIFYFIYKVFVKDDKDFLIYLYLFLLLQSFIFIELSIFIIVSIIFQTLVKNNIKIEKNLTLKNLIILIIIILIFLFNNFNSDNYFSNFNFIFLGPELNLFDLSVITILLSLVMYIVSSSVADSKNHLFIRIIGGYCIFSLLYFVWNPAYNHLGPIIWPFSFLLLFFIDKFIIIKNFTTTFMILFLTTIFTISFATKHFYIEKNLFYTSLTSYLKVYKLDINNKINMESTINPKYIEDSCKLMNKYNKNLSINMISIHDSYLPFLCNKANSKYDQLIINMVNDEIKMDAYSYFINEEIIFVDNFIDNPNQEIYYKIYSEALHYRIKILAIQQARDLFNKIIEDGNYKLIDKGELISVYMKKN
tara:strand:- start:15089 stop:16783 length:1695 start_codon:yes stop_codon:yes gene_type:complete